METLERQFTSQASRAAAHLKGCNRALAQRSWTGNKAAWIALVCLHSGAFASARCVRSLDAHPEQVRRITRISGGVVAAETVPGIRGIGRCAASMPGAPTVCLRGRVSRRKLKRSPGRVSRSKRPMRQSEPERPWPLRTGMSITAKAGEPAYPPWPHSVCLPEGLAGGCAPCDPPTATARVMSAGCAVWVKVRTSATTRRSLHAAAKTSTNRASSRRPLRLRSWKATGSVACRSVSVFLETVVAAVVRVGGGVDGDGVQLDCRVDLQQGAAYSVALDYVADLEASDALPSLALSNSARKRGSCASR